jgi:hypothetical protein
MKKMYFVQSLVLLAGTIFAWFTVYADSSRFYNLYGNITRISDCVIPNPITTPCFYGAFAFLGAFIWSLYILRFSKEKKIIHQKRINILLIASTIFAWSNLALEIYNFYLQKTSPKVSCSGVATDNIFTTACFIGSMLFLTSLIISFVINSKNKNNVSIKKS